MSDEISLLPSELRKKEEALKHPGASKNAPAGSELDFSVPKEEEEDIEVIEIDEGEIEQVLESEPFLTRVAYKFGAAIEDLKNRFFQPPVSEAPPKLPPQFFTPPPVKAKAPPKAEVQSALEPGKPGLPEKSVVAVEAKAKAKIKPKINSQILALVFWKIAIAKIINVLGKAIKTSVWAEGPWMICIDE